MMHLVMQSFSPFSLEYNHTIATVALLFNSTLSVMSVSTCSSNYRDIGVATKKNYLKYLKCGCGFSWRLQCHNNSNNIHILSHWAHFTERRFICVCVYFVCFFVSYCTVVVSL